MLSHQIAVISIDPVVVAYLWSLFFFSLIKHLQAFQEPLLGGDWRGISTQGGQKSAGIFVSVLRV